MIQPAVRHHSLENRQDLPQEGIERTQPILNLISRLCGMLAEEDINYCHWKSNNALDRSASGENDLDLLVDREDITRFSRILSALGFRKAKAPSEKQIPAVVDYFGLDEETGCIVHVHAHYQLVMGHDLSKNYRLPIEKAYLESAVQDGMFKVPALEFEYIVFVIRMILKHATFDVMLSREGKLKAGEQRELSYLQGQVYPFRVEYILEQHLPYIPVEFFRQCVQALQPGCPVWRRIKTGIHLQKNLQANARRPVRDDILVKLFHRAVLRFQRHILKRKPKYNLESGGAVIAILGGDGAGKSTLVEGLYTWLSENFDTTRMHMGKPDWSLTTRFIRGILKIGQVAGLYPVEATFQQTLTQKSIVSPGYPWLIREVCRARDRYLTYLKARRSAARGGLVLLDRYPLSQIHLMDGPQAQRFVRLLEEMPQAKGKFRPHSESRLTKKLIKREENYYVSILPPEILIVLRVEPEVAVQRKIDEDPLSVRTRSTEIWEVRWDSTPALVVDSSKPKNDVLAQVKALVWSRL